MNEETSEEREKRERLEFWESLSVSERRRLIELFGQMLMAPETEQWEPQNLTSGFRLQLPGTVTAKAAGNT